MPLPTLKELLERFPDGFYGCFAANWSEMDYKSGGTVGGKGCYESTRAATSGCQRPPQLAPNSRTLDGPDRFRLPTERGPSAKYEVGLLVWAYILGFKLKGNPPFAHKIFSSNFIFHIGSSNPRFLLQAGKGVSGLVSRRSGPARRSAGVRCPATLKPHWSAIGFRADPHCLLNPPSIFSNFDRRR